MLIGVTFAPLGVMDDYGSRNLNTDKLFNICCMLENSHIIASDTVGEQIRKAIHNQSVICWSELNMEAKQEFDIYKWNDDEPCLLMFTSGSTGIPKGNVIKQMKK